MNDDDPVWLNQQETAAWLALWSVGQWLPTRLGEQLKRTFGVNMSDYFVLAQISMAPDEQITMSELATLSDMSPSRLSHVVSRLEKYGFVVRSRHPRDRRTNVASITDEGRTFIRRAAPEHVGQVRQLVFDALTPDEVPEFGRMLTKIMDRLEPPGLPRV